MKTPSIQYQYSRLNLKEDSSASRLEKRLPTALSGFLNSAEHRNKRREFPKQRCTTRGDWPAYRRQEASPGSRSFPSFAEKRSRSILFAPPSVPPECSFAAV